MMPLVKFGSSSLAARKERREKLRKDVNGFVSLNVNRVFRFQNVKVKKERREKLRKEVNGFVSLNVNRVFRFQKVKVKKIKI